jgi:anti-sigma factor RsiW
MNEQQHMHLDDRVMQQLVDREALDDRASIEHHLAHCPACRDRLAAARAEDVRIGHLLSALDEPMPTVSSTTVLSEAMRTPTRVWLRRAAVLVVSIGLSAVAYAFPGSPLPRWLGRQPARAIAPQPVPTQARPADVSGIAVSADEPVTVIFVSELPASRIRIMETDERQLAVRGSDAAATFSYDPGRVLVSGYVTSAQFDVIIPRTAMEVTVQVGERVLFRSAQRP